jgi:hypothetical protein
MEEQSDATLNWDRLGDLLNIKSDLYEMRIIYYYSKKKCIIKPIVHH